jgi:hypothetical protein
MKTILNFLLLPLVCATMTAQSKSAHLSEQYVFNLGGVDEHVVRH